MSIRNGGLSMAGNTQSGNVLFIILIAVALLGALGAVMMRSGGEQAVSMSADRISQELKAQAQSIRSALMECVLVNNYGYPAQGANKLASEAECQIDDVPTYQPIFTGTANRFLPQPPSTFNPWQYTNDNADDIQIYTDSTKPASPAVINALEMLKNQYSADEIEIINDGSNASFRLYITKP